MMMMTTTTTTTTREDVLFFHKADGISYNDDGLHLLACSLEDDAQFGARVEVVAERGYGAEEAFVVLWEGFKV